MHSNLEPDVRNQESHEIRRQYLDASKAHQALGWKPLYTIEEGLERTIGWYREFFGQGS
jgi:CDP-glucose 4,6-dehydratase